MFRGSLQNEYHQQYLPLQGDELFFYLNVEDVFGWVKERPVMYVDPPKKRKRFQKQSFQRLDELNVGDSGS